MKKCLLKNFYSDRNLIKSLMILAAAYTKKELEKTKPEIQLLQIEPRWNDDFVWRYDWDEGQQFFKFYGIFTEPELLAIIFKEEDDK